MVRSIEKQTGHKRVGPKAIRQDFSLLIKITEYDFDLYNPDFQEYCRTRGVLYKAGSGKRFDLTANHSATKEEFFGLFRCAMTQPDGSIYRYTASEMDTHWEIMLAAKGAMQDCWELFSGK